MNAHDITEAMFTPAKRQMELCTQARQAGEKFFKLYAEQGRIAYEEGCKMQDRAMEIVRTQQDVLQGYVEKTIELSLAAVKP
ncbi:MAG TPA: hypothetical protein VGO93_16940 [Candidatus Xenobia bacterium]|jgi:hypothetical protein